MKTKNKIIVLVPIFIITAFILGVFLWNIHPSFQKTITFFQQPKTVIETLTIPNTKVVDEAVGRTPSTDHYAVLLVPVTEGDKVVVPGAVFTLKKSFDVAQPVAIAWAKDAKLVFLTSQGAVTLTGESSMWQVVFGSLSEKKGYEVIVEGDKVVSEKEIFSTEYGYDLPINWYDADEAIKSIQSLPQFAEATISSINFYYNKDSKRWGYALGTSKGTISMPVR